MKVVVGVDSGGSKTRALAVSLDGERVAYAETGGGHLQHDETADDNLREAIARASEGHRMVRLVAGVAGLNEPEHETRIAGFLTHLDCPLTLLNDAAIAHFAAFGDGAGIVSIQGTGSTIRAVLEDGRVVRNGDFFHYARSGAVWLGIRAVQRLLIDPSFERDQGLRDAALNAWEVDSLSALREALSRQAELTPLERTRRYGAIARAVTASAEWNNLASASVCYAAAREITDGIRLLAGAFVLGEVPVALVGSCVQSSVIRANVVRRLRSKSLDVKQYRIIDTDVSPVVGAVLMALREEGVELAEEPKRRLASP